MTDTVVSKSIAQTPIGDLKPYDKNPRTHSAEQITQIAASITEFGFTNPILVADGEVVAGHGRLEAAKLLGLEQVPVIDVSHLSAVQRRAYVIVDNQLALNAEWDDTLLGGEVISLEGSEFDLSLLGFSTEELAYLSWAPSAEHTDPDSIPAIGEGLGSVISRGDIYVLGKHRVMCGDATDLADVALLMQKKKADMVFTDPPYLMNFTGALSTNGAEHKNHSVMLNDNLSTKEGDLFLLSFCNSLKQMCLGPWYITFYRLGIDRLFVALNASNLKWRNLIIWKKNAQNLSNSDYKSMYEPMFVGWSDDYTPIVYGWNSEHSWCGRKNEKDVWEVEIPSVWEVDKPKKNDLHPTMKPVALVSRAIVNSSKVGQIVGDLFLGSGTTLIASERTGRTCYGMELDPKYCEVIIRRWQNFTGLDAKNAATGQPFSEVVGN